MEDTKGFGAVFFPLIGFLWMLFFPVESMEGREFHLNRVQENSLEQYLNHAASAGGRSEWMEIMETGMGSIVADWETAASFPVSDRDLIRRRSKTLKHTLDQRINRELAQWLIRKFSLEAGGVNVSKFWMDMRRASTSRTFVQGETGLEKDKSGDWRVRPVKMADWEEESRNFRKTWEAEAGKRVHVWFGGLETAYGELQASLTAEQSAELSRSRAPALKTLRRAQERELSKVLNLEQSFMARNRLMDVRSLRRHSEKRTESRRGETFVLDTQKEIKKRLSQLDLHLRKNYAADPIEIERKNWLESFSRELERGLGLWDKAEETLLLNRMEWKKEAAEIFSSGEGIWKDGMERLRKSHIQWTDQHQKILHQGRKNWETRGREMDSQLKESWEKMNAEMDANLGLLMRKGEVLRGVVLRSRETMKMARNNFVYWMNKATGKKSDEENPALWTIEQMRRFYLGKRTQNGAWEEAAYWAEEVFARNQKKSKEAREELYGLYRENAVPFSFEETGDHLLDDFLMELSKARMSADYWEKQKNLAAAVVEYAKDESSGRESRSETEQNYQRGVLEHRASLKNYDQSLLNLKENRILLDKIQQEIGKKRQQLILFSKKLSKAREALQQEQIRLQIGSRSSPMNRKVSNVRNSESKLKKARQNVADLENQIKRVEAEWKTLIGRKGERSGTYRNAEKQYSRLYRDLREKEKNLKEKKEALQRIKAIRDYASSGFITLEKKEEYKNGIYSAHPVKYLRAVEDRLKRARNAVGRLERVKRKTQNTKASFLTDDEYQNLTSRLERGKREEIAAVHLKKSLDRYTQKLEMDINQLKIRQRGLFDAFAGALKKLDGGALDAPHGKEEGKLLRLIRRKGHSETRILGGMDVLYGENGNPRITYNPLNPREENEGARLERLKEFLGLKESAENRRIWTEVFHDLLLEMNGMSPEELQAWFGSITYESMRYWDETEFNNVPGRDMWLFRHNITKANKSLFGTTPSERASKFQVEFNEVVPSLQDTFWKHHKKVGKGTSYEFFKFLYLGDFLNRDRDGSLRKAGEFGTLAMAYRATKNKTDNFWNRIFDWKKIQEASRAASIKDRQWKTYADDLKRQLAEYADLHVRMKHLLEKQARVDSNAQVGTVGFFEILGTVAGESPLFLKRDLASWVGIDLKEEKAGGSEAFWEEQIKNRFQRYVVPGQNAAEIMDVIVTRAAQNRRTVEEKRTGYIRNFFYGLENEKIKAKTQIYRGNSRLPIDSIVSWRLGALNREMALLDVWKQNQRLNEELEGSYTLAPLAEIFQYKPLLNNLKTLFVSRRESFFNFQRYRAGKLMEDEIFQRNRWENQMKTILSEGRSEWKSTEQRIGKAVQNWRAQFVRNLRETKELWSAQYSSFLEGKNDWVRAAAEQSLGVGSREILATFSGGTRDKIAAHSHFIIPGVLLNKNTEEVVSQILEFEVQSDFPRILGISEMSGTRNFFDSAMRTRLSSRSGFLDKIRAFQTENSRELRSRTARIQYEQMLDTLNRAVDMLRNLVDQSNENFAGEIKRILIGDGFRRNGKEFTKKTLVTSTLWNNTYENHRIEGYRYYRPQLNQINSQAHSFNDSVIDELGYYGIMGILDLAIKTLEEEKARIFKTELKTHLGKAPRFKSDADGELNLSEWEKNVEEPGLGELERIMGLFMQHQLIEATAIAEFDKPFYEQKLWDDRNIEFKSINLRSVLDIAVAAIATAVSGGAGSAPLISALIAAGVNFTDDLVLGIADIGTGYKNLEDSLESLGKKALTSALSGAVGSAGINLTQNSHFLVKTLADGGRAAVNQTSRALIGAVDFQNIGRGNWFHQDQFIKSLNPAGFVAGMFGNMASNTLDRFSLEGFLGDVMQRGQLLNQTIGTGTSASLEFLMKGETTMNLLNFADFFSNNTTAIRPSAGLLELNLKAGQGGRLSIGRGGHDLSAGKIHSSLEGMEMFFVNDTIRRGLHRSRTDSRLKTAMRTLYSDTAEGRTLFDKIMDGRVKVVLGENFDYQARRVNPGRINVNPSNATPLDLSVILTHEAYRDGINNGEEAQRTETKRAVSEHMDTALKILSSYGQRRLGENIAVEALALKGAQITGDRTVLDELKKPYNSSADFWKITKEGELLYDGRRGLYDEDDVFVTVAVDSDGQFLDEQETLIQYLEENFPSKKSTKAALVSWMREQKTGNSGKSNPFRLMASEKIMEQMGFRNEILRSMKQYNAIQRKTNLFHPQVLDNIGIMKGLGKKIRREQGRYNRQYLKSGVMFTPENVITQNFGNRLNRLKIGKNKYISYDHHSGVDTANRSKGNGVVSPGFLEFVENPGKGGHAGVFKLIGTDVHFKLLHMDPRHMGALKKGEILRSGQKIGDYGLWGNTSGPHLHLEATRLNRERERRFVDPLQFGPKRNRKKQSSWEAGKPKLYPKEYFPYRVEKKNEKGDFVLIRGGFSSLPR